MQRREFLRRAAATTGVAALGGQFWHQQFSLAEVIAGPGPYGPLQSADPNGVQVPVGFTCRIIATTGVPVAPTTSVWHAAPDGGSCFPTADGGWVYVSNSEVALGGGGVGALRFDSSGATVDAYRILSGTHRNCAGGTTPWGTWLSCEENGSVGKVYECNPLAAGEGVQRPALGSFNHEAAGVDPLTGIVYLTEDHPTGRLYRFVPTTPGDLSSGSLFAANVAGSTVTWVPTSTTIPDRQLTTTAFNGGEGIWIHGGRMFFTTKGDGRVWELVLATQTLTVLYDDSTTVGAPLTGVDNITVHQHSGDLYVAEDGGNMEICLIAMHNGVREVTPFLRVNGQETSELTGPAFSPDGTRLYFSSQRGTDGTTGITYEITGPFPTPPNAGPSALFTASQDGLSVAFDASASTDADGTITGYQWSFGDGTTGTGAAVAHTYATAGTYTVALTVTDDDDASTTTTTAITVAAGNAGPSALFTSSQDGLSVAFDASASTDPDGMITSYQWSFGDGSTGVGAITAHTYVTAGTYTVALTVTDDDAATITTTTAITVVGGFPATSSYTSLQPSRLLDTRPGGTTVDGVSAGGGALGPNSTIELTVVGRGGVPATGVGAVVLNITATQPTTPGYVTVHPTGTALPNASNLNFAAGQTTPNLTIARVGDGGKISLYNSAGDTHLIADVVGWFPATSSYTSLQPSRLLDTRPGGTTVDGVSAGGGALGPNSTIELTVVGRGGVPATGVGAVVLNITATQPTTPGYVTVHPTGTALPNASNLNFAAGQTTPNLTIARVGDGGKISLYNSAGDTHLIADVVGWFTATSSYTSLQPSRLLDTRPGGTTVDGVSAGGGALGPNSTIELTVVGRGGVPATGVGAVVLNITATQPTTPGYVTVHPTGTALPNASNLNFAAGQTTPNLTIARVGDGGKISLYNSAGDTHLIADVVGWFPTTSSPPPTP